MTNAIRKSPYAVKRDGRCPTCDAVLRLNGRCMACGFQRGAAHPPRVVIDGLVYDAPPPERQEEPWDVKVVREAAERIHWKCVDCGQPAKSLAGLSAHRRAKHKES